jgi:antitoxin VapB
MSSEPEAGAQRALVDTPRKIEAADAKPSETEAELLCTDRKVPLSERVRPIQERMLSRPRTGLKADKAFFDELSGDI